MLRTFNAIATIAGCACFVSGILHGMDSQNSTAAYLIALAGGIALLAGIVNAYADGRTQGMRNE